MMNKDLLLCKAKRVDNGEWVEGYYYPKKYSGNKHFMRIFPNQDDEFEEVVIDIDTRCRCTGKKDIEDKLTFEGDYFWHLQEEGLIGLIKWDKEELRWNVAIVPNIKSGKCVPDPTQIIEWWELREYEEIKIIGNIHD